MQIYSIYILQYPLMWMENCNQTVFVQGQSFNPAVAQPGPETSQNMVRSHTATPSAELHPLCNYMYLFYKCVKTVTV